MHGCLLRDPVRVVGWEAPPTGATNVQDWMGIPAASERTHHRVTLTYSKVPRLLTPAHSALLFQSLTSRVQRNQGCEQRDEPQCVCTVCITDADYLATVTVLQYST